MKLLSSAELARIRAYIAANTARFVAELCDLLAIESVTQEPRGIAACAQSLQRHFEEVGCPARLYETPGNPIVIATTSAIGHSQAILVYGHYDVMPADERGEGWASPPFTPTLRQGRVFARGAGDNKAQHFAHLKALEALRACDLGVPAVTFVIEGEEESGSASLPKFLSEHRELLRARFCYAADGPRHELNRPTVYLGSRGLLGIEITFDSGIADAHSGNRGNIIPGSAWRLVECLASLRSANRQPAVRGFLDGVRPFQCADGLTVGSLPYDGDTLSTELRLPALRSIDATEYYRRLAFSPTLNISGLLTGYTGPGLKTVIPARASAKIDCRLVADQTPESVLEALRDHLAAAGFADARIDVLDAMPPYRLDLEHPLVGPVVAAVRAATGTEPVVWPSLGGTTPQSVFHEVLGLPCLWSAYANWDQGNHGPNENMSVACFLEGVAISASVLFALGR